MQNFSDIFKKNFLETFNNTDISSGRIAVTLIACTVIALYIFVIYRIYTRKTFYSKTFNVSLVAMSLITAAIILAMQSNLVISLGMVGALSIVRFRTAIKSPMDLVFLFWSISIGIICGAGLYEIAFVASLLTTIVILVLDWIPTSKASTMLVINSTDLNAEPSIIACVKGLAGIVRVKSRNYENGRLDMIIEIRTKKEAELVSALSEIDSVEYVSVVNHDGEVTF